MNLPNGFLDVMKETLRDDFDEYLSFLDKTPYRGMRINTLKADVDLIRDKIGFETEPLPFSDKGFYIDNDLKGVGNHPFHHCGAIYLQEPSAMSVVTVLDVKKGDKILDLCAAPGGKSTQIADLLCGEGLLWSNEYINSRAKILASNLERCGVKNSVVSNADTKTIAENFEGYFDKVLVDAPCSGEGMIRREINAITEWKIENREMCALRQAEILDNAARCVRTGGTLIYSTCTLSLEENEITIENFLKRNPGFELAEINQKFGRDGYVYHTKNKEISKTRRILFQDGGEGHFIAKLINKNDTCCSVKDFEYNSFEDKVFDDFYNDIFISTPSNSYENNGIIYLLPKVYPKTKGIKIIKAGVKAGEMLKNRFAPSHELFMSKTKSEIKKYIDLSIFDDNVNQFLKGLEIDCDEKGYVAVLVEGMTIGFGKASNGKLKNHYPKGLRIF